MKEVSVIVNYTQFIVWKQDVSSKRHHIVTNFEECNDLVIHGSLHKLICNPLWLSIRFEIKPPSGLSHGYMLCVKTVSKESQDHVFLPSYIN